MVYKTFVFFMICFLPPSFANDYLSRPPKKEIAYVVSDIEIPFWKIMSYGIKSQAKKLGYEVSVYSANNIKKNELQNMATALKNRVAGIVISPISSSTAVTLLKLASRAKIPVVISDIGADSGEYVSFITSDNALGAYEIGRVLTKKMKQLDWEDATVGIIAIPQKRSNGQARTAGFLKALQEAKIKSSGILQQVDFSYAETYAYAKKLIYDDPKLRAIWLQGSDKYQAALDAIKDSGKEGKVLLLCFDAEPEFLEMIPKGALVGSAMQQPFLMGEKALLMMHKHLNDEKVIKEIELPVLAISAQNIYSHLPLIKRNVLGLEEK